MKDITCYSANVLAQFDNDINNVQIFEDLAMDASHGIYTKYQKSEANVILRNQFEKVLGINYKESTPMKRRQAWRLHGIEACSLVEDIIVDRMNSGWDATNAKFMDYVRDVNIAAGDENLFTVSDPSLLTVSVWASGHHDVVRQKALPGQTFTIQLSNYVIKVYADFDQFMMGKIDFEGMIDLMYRSIEQYRYSALYTAFMSMDQYLPSDMKLDTAITDQTKASIIDHIEAVKAATGRDVILVGTRSILSTLQGTVSYNMYSGNMKDEVNQKGILGMWEGYECLALDRVNVPGTRTSVFSADDNKKIFILPVDPEFKPIVRVNEGDVELFIRGEQGDMQDRTIEATIWYREGVGVVINEMFGVITKNA